MDDHRTESKILPKKLSLIHILSFEDNSILGYLVPKNEIAAALPAHSQVIAHRGNQVFNYPFLLDNQNIVMNLLRNTADDTRRSDEQEEAKA